MGSLSSQEPSESLDPFELPMTLKLIDTKVSHVVMVHMVQWFMGVHQKPSPMVSSRSCRSHPGQLEQTGTRVSQGPGFIDAHLQPGVTA